jgi:hypothetical protein
LIAPPREPNSDAPSPLAAAGSENLFVGPSVEEILGGQDLAAFSARLADPNARLLFDYWCRLLREHGLAMKPHFDVTQIPSTLSNIYMEEYDVERRQSRMRLMGETLNSQWAERVVGLCTDDYVSGATAELWKASDKAVYFERHVAILTYDLKYIHRPHCTLIDLALPMDDQDGNKFCIGYAWQKT